MNTILMLLLLVSSISCRSGLVPVSKRSLSFKQNGEMVVRSRKVEEPAKPPEIFIKQTKQVIVSKGPAAVSGSLYNIEDPRNILLVEKPRGLVGTYLDVKVESNRLENTENDENEADPTSKDELEKTLLKALPDLNAGKENPVLLRSLKLRVGNRLPSGDVLVSLARSSSNKIESNSIKLVARIPFDVLKEKRPLTTKDLYDVEWIESLDGDVFERKSMNWEDEYTLRLSGFSEAKSKAALSLEEKKKQLKKVKSQMQSQLQNMTSQRVKIAQERSRLRKIEEKHEEEKRLLREEVESRNQSIDEQKQAYKELEEEKEALRAELREVQKNAEDAASGEESAGEGQGE